MTSFAPGARVVIRDEEWVVRKTDRNAVHVRGQSELVRGKDAIFLPELEDIREMRPEDTELVHDETPRFSRSRLYLESLIRRTPPPAGDNTLYLGHEAALDRRDYQLEPAVQALSQPRARILMADGVGLGKTIQVGILLTELIERHRGGRILVVALQSILAQFQEELWSRFTIPLVRLDSVGLQRVQSRIPSSMNPFHYYDRVIISKDTLKNAKYEGYLRNCDWDVIVIDECQNVAVRSKGKGSSQHSQRAQLARLLANTCDSLILTSATPHDGSARSFASLIHLLEPTAIADPEDFTFDDVKDYCIRRSKKDIEHEEGVADSFRDRALEPIKLPASEPENAVFRCLKDIEFQTIARGRNSKGSLFRTTLLKAFLSSPAACLETVNNRLEHKDLQDGDDPAVDHDHDELRALRSLLEAVTPEHFAKYQQLHQHLSDLGFAKKNNQDRVVLFSERIATLDFLREHLIADLKLKADAVATFTGHLDDRSQQDIVDSFGRGDSPIRILLASDAAAEGLNLHWHCHRLVHFDLPWSLITLEQRNGRIDRYGQTETPILTHLLTTPADEDLRGDLRILDRLIEKEDVAHKNLGDAAVLMGLHNAGDEEDKIAEAIETRQDPESVIPDEPEDALFDLLFGTDPREDRPTVVTTRDASLFGDDYAYCKEALDNILGSENAHLVDFEDHLEGFILRAPEDLQARLTYLPPELTKERSGDHTVFKLSQKRDFVIESLEESRTKRGKWPEWQLLWEQHPVCEWIDDSVLANFTRHQAPILTVTRGVDTHTSVILFQGVVTNNRGQPAVVEWFGVPFLGEKAGKPIALADLLTATGLDSNPTNPNQPVPAEEEKALRARLPAAVKVAEAHMKQHRLKRMEQLSEPIRTGLARLQNWRRDRLERIDKQRKATPQRRKQLDIEEREALTIYETRKQWIEGIKTAQTPYLRVAAVLVPAHN